MLRITQDREGGEGFVNLFNHLCLICVLGSMAFVFAVEWSCFKEEIERVDVVSTSII